MNHMMITIGINDSSVMKAKEKRADGWQIEKYDSNIPNERG